MQRRIAQEDEWQLQTLDGFLLVLRRLCAQAEDLCREHLEFCPQVTEGARFGSTTARTGDAVPVSDQRRFAGATCPWIREDNGEPRDRAKIKGGAICGGQAH